MNPTQNAGFARSIGRLERSVLGVKLSEVHRLLPGLLVAAFVALLSNWLSEYLGVTVMGFEQTPISPVMLAILLGLITGFVIRLPQALELGLRFAVNKVLRLGVIMLGIRLTVFDVFRLGAHGVPIVVLCILGALFFTTRLNSWLRLPDRLGVLIAAGTSICGVSAIVATGPAINAEEEEVAYAVAVITVFGLLATLAYPYAASVIFRRDALRTGLFLGTAVHDTSQVVGSATVYGDVFAAPLALDVATVTKLVRNVFMAAVIPFMTLHYARVRHEPGESSGKKIDLLGLLPLFVVGFLIAAVIRSVGDASIRVGANAFGLWDGETWSSVYSVVGSWAGSLLVLALAAVGLSTDFRRFRGMGIRPFLVGLGAALVVGGVSFIAIALLGSLVTF